MHPNNLPLQLTTLVGRNRELEALRRLLRDDRARFVTLTGPGGSGKTRLAREIAGELLDDFPDGAFLVSLAPIRDPALVVLAIAQALEVRPAGSLPVLEAVTGFLQDRGLLLVLDNFEQVLDAAPVIPELLTPCPRLQIIVTSRAALHLRGEREFPVPPLALPDRHQLPPVEELHRYAAVSLYIERAQAINPDLSLDAGTLRNIAEICARLDGLPLAIELAAARTKLLTPAAILARLERRLPVLGGGARDLPERQRTLRDTIAWSHDLLTPVEQALFRQVSVFVGGCDLETVEAVAGNGVDVIDGLASLVDKNLLGQAEMAGPQARFAMLETIREFGLEMLEAHGELDLAQRRHVEHFLALAEEAKQHMPEAGQEQWVIRLEREHDNLRAALRWLIDRRDASAGLRLATALEQFWQLRGYLSEGRAWLEAILAIGTESASGGPPEMRARALTSLGMLALSQSDFDVARRHHEEALQLYRAAGDDWSAAVAINDLATVALYRAEYAEAQELYGESLEIRRRLDDRRGEAVCLTNLGLAAQALGDFRRARDLHEQALAIRRDTGDRAGVASSLSRLGTVATDEGDYATARAYLREALGVARARGDDMGVGWSLTNLGAVAYELGEFDEARELIEEGLRIRRRLGDKAAIARSLWHLQRLASAQGDLNLARTTGEEAVPLVRGVGDKRGLTIWSSDLGDVLMKQGDAEAARACYEESLTLRRQVGDESGAAVTLAKLAHALLALGEVPMARRQLRESVAGLRGVDEPRALATSLVNLAQLAGSQGDHLEAEASYREALTIEHERGGLEITVLCLNGLATTALTRGDLIPAARLGGAAEGLQTRLGSTTRPIQDRLDNILSPARSDAERAAITQAWAAGCAMTLDESIAYVLGEGANRSDDGAAPYPDGLSDREVDVLRLIAAGRTNPEIAAELVISVNTVYRHANHIFGKTGAANRVEAATYAQRHGLL